MKADGLLSRLLAIESRSARLEGAFAADPELGLMWRSGAALTEACRSVALEDIHVYEGDVIHRHLENRVTDTEAARGAEAVSGLLGVIAAPGDIREDTSATLDRCWRASVSTDQEAGGYDRDRAVRSVRQSISDAPTPFLGALKAAVAFRTATGSASPSADRLVFMATEHALRREERTREQGGVKPSSILRRVDAGWILTPSAALSQGGFRAWSPGTPPGFANLVDGLIPELDRAIGSIGVLRQWRDVSRDIAGSRNARSRLRDLVSLAVRDPLLTPAYVREALGVSRRASFTLIDEAEAAGILKLVTPRSSWRVWARPDMAQRIAMRSTRSRNEREAEKGVGVDQAERETSTRGMTPGDLDAQETREAEALQALDEAMARADAVLAKYSRPQ